MLASSLGGNFAFADYVVMIGYVVGVVALGLLFTTKERNTTDYLLGGKNFPWWAITISIFATAFSAISFVAIPEEAYTNGLRLWLRSLIGPLIIPVAFWMFLGFYYSLGSFTPYEYIEKRFSSKVRLLSSLIFIVIKGLYLAIILYASAKAFEGAVGWKPWFTIIVIGLLGTLYTTMGGMKAVVWTDVAQFFVLGGGIFMACLFVINKVDGGFLGVFEYAFEHGRGFNLDKTFISVDPHERASVWWMIIATLGAMLSAYATDQLMVQRLLSTKTYSQAKKAVFLSVPISMLVLSMFWFVGIGMFCYYNQAGAEKLREAGASASTVFSFFITTELPTPIPGLIMAALLAAIMSTVDSCVNSLSAVAVKDIYLRFIRPDADEMKQLRVSKYLTAVWGLYMIIAALGITWISQKASSTIMEVIGIWSSLGGIILGIYILGVTSVHIATRWVLTSAVISTVMLVLGVVEFYYRRDVDSRISFMLVGNIGLLSMLFFGYLGVIWNKFIVRNPEPENLKGLTLWSIDRSALKNK